MILLSSSKKLVAEESWNSHKILWISRYLWFCQFYRQFVNHLSAIVFFLTYWSKKVSPVMMLNMSKVSDNRSVVSPYPCFTPFDDIDHFGDPWWHVRWMIWLCKGSMMEYRLYFPTVRTVWNESSYIGPRVNNYNFHSETGWHFSVEKSV